MLYRTTLISLSHFILNFAPSPHLSGFYVTDSKTSWTLSHPVFYKSRVHYFSNIAYLPTGMAKQNTASALVLLSLENMSAMIVGAMVEQLASPIPTIPRIKTNNQKFCNKFQQLCHLIYKLFVNFRCLAIITEFLISVRIALGQISYPQIFKVIIYM